jgi:hypothetical protein
LFKNRTFTNASSTINISNFIGDSHKDRYSKTINVFMDMLKEFITSDTNINKEDFMNYSMMVYSSNKTEVDSLVRSYENFARNRYQPAKIPNYDISRNARLSIPHKRNTW